MGAGGAGGGVCSEGKRSNLSLRESKMADTALVLAVLAGFALVALVAKGVTKL